MTLDWECEALQEEYPRIISFRVMFPLDASNISSLEMVEKLRSQKAYIQPSHPSLSQLFQVMVNSAHLNTFVSSGS